MGLFDKLLGRVSSDQNKTTELAKTDKITALDDPSSIERAIAQRCENIQRDNCIQVSFGDVAALGTVFSQMIPALRTISMSGVGYLPVNMAAGEVLKSAGQGLYYGAHVAKDGASVMTKWAKAGPTSGVMPINPAIIMVAAMLANIEKKLDDIQETQLKILSFLEQDKRAEQQGNLNVLTDMLNGYKHNWDNDQYLRNHHMKALDIKQASQKNVVFYQEQIASAIKKLPSVHLDQAVMSAMGELGKLFGDYRMALYLFAFSSFLEVMLLRNFHEEYLNQVADSVHAYDEQYQVQFAKCRDLIKTYASESVETKVLTGLGGIAGALGDLIGASPVLSKGSVDEWLKDSRKKLLKGNDEKIEKTLSMFAQGEDNAGSIFIDSIKNVDAICNHTTDILVDGETLYLAVA